MFKPQQNCPIKFLEVIMKILSRSFYQEDTVIMAKKLLGKKIVRTINGRRLVGIISETEAYTSDDPASHCFIGLTQRNQSMFGPVGHAYVYISYGIHFCFNIVARSQEHQAGGVLIRAVIPVEGLDIIINNRLLNNKNLNKSDIKNLCNGPAKVTQAFLINKDHDSLDLTNSNPEFFIADQSDEYVISDNLIEVTPRIGISVAKDKLWRFKLKDNFNI
ncbi:3-methyladenine DNA glycosylase [Candidatus Babela massiliensis]|uniref:Putative 3-methyladenine DNA glycosylase n=2 Tax=Candidatus Babela massiliensis TaxID=673862 RepID=V6DFG4_9BACT|nr:3-methyladenine DNA glycosylase [Candidatus Babela massiliensis]